MTEISQTETVETKTETMPESADSGGEFATSGQVSVKKVIFDQALYRYLTLAWGGIVAALSLSPSMPSQIHYASDKVEHMAAYAVLCFLAMRGWSGTRFMFLIFLGVMFYGALMEGVQWYVPGRSMEALDALANCFGAFAGLIVASVWIAAKSKRTPPLVK